MLLARVYPASGGTTNSNKGIVSSRQKEFGFFVGDINKNRKAVKLPFGGYHEEPKVAVQYSAIQHIESRQILPQQNIQLIELSYSDFNHDKQNKIIRNTDIDEGIVRRELIPVQLEKYTDRCL